MGCGMCKGVAGRRDEKLVGAGARCGKCLLSISGNKIEHLKRKESPPLHGLVGVSGDGDMG